MRKAIALFSGGLDSVLSILAIKNQGIEVIGLTFISLFGSKSTDEIIEKNQKLAERFGFEMIYSDFTKEQFKIIKNPVYGLGKNLNPCMDCHILMLKEAKKIMLEQGADFIITGEVIGQRPKSQRRDTFPVIDKDAGLEGLVLRPLSAKNMKATIPEINGWVDREKLYDIGGRGRKKQIELAKSISWEDFPAPAGGCLLTDIGYSNRLKNIIKGDNIPDKEDIMLVPVGRHFIIDNSRIISGRNKEDNEIIFNLASNDEMLFQATDCGSPFTIIKGEINDTTINIAAGITARYCDKKNEENVKVRIFNKGGEERYINISPSKDEDIRKFIIG